MSTLKDSAQTDVIELAPDNWDPAVKPDPLIRQKHGLIGAPVSRRDGEFKAKGEATCAAEFPARTPYYYSGWERTAAHEVQRYAKPADQTRMARNAVERLRRTAGQAKEAT